MALVNSEIYTVLMTIDPANRDLANKVFDGWMRFGRDLIVDADQSTVSASVYSSLKIADDAGGDGDTIIRLIRSIRNAAPLPLKWFETRIGAENITQAEVDTLYASMTARTIRARYDDELGGDTKRNLFFFDGEPWRAYDAFTRLLGREGLSEPVEPEPLPDRYAFTKEMLNDAAWRRAIRDELVRVAGNRGITLPNADATALVKAAFNVMAPRWDETA